MANVKRKRSPNFPVVSLKSGLDYVERLHKYANGQHFVPMLSAIEEAWGMKKGSAYGKQVVGALKSFSLVEDSGSGDARKIRVSDSASKIRGGHSDRDSLLRAAALSPTIHKELWSEFANGEGLPPDVTLRQYLLFDRDGNHFNESAVDDFIAEFRETLEFAKVDSRETGPEVDTSNNVKDPEGSQGEIEVGSFVQWTSQGVDQFEIPRAVLGIQDGFVFVEGSQTGLPMQELSATESPVDESTPAASPPVNPFYTPATTQQDEPKGGMALDRTTLDEGAVRLEWPDELTPESVEEFQDWMVGRINRARRKAGLGKIRIED